jgi:hypothetical protein
MYLCGYSCKHLEFHRVSVTKVKLLVLFRESYETHKYNLWAQFRALIFTALGTHNYHVTLKDCWVVLLSTERFKFANCCTISVAQKTVVLLH